MKNDGCGANGRGALRVAEARARMLDLLRPVDGWECVALRHALDRILVDDVIAPFNVPAHDNSAMDGYAVRAADLDASAPTRLKVVGTAFAGKSFSGLVDAGQAVRIMTGAVMPAGSDAVVIQEIATVDGDYIGVPGGQRSGQNVRRMGEDLAAGKPALRAGTRIGPAELGLAASLGIAEVRVRRRLRVAFFSTGDELASIGHTLGAGEVYDSNRYTLFGALTRLGVEVIDMGVVRDDPELIETAFTTASATADVVITTGGVSVGEADYVKALVARLGEVRFWKMEIKPGRPMAFGRIGSAWFFGLPGNPVAVMVSFYQLALDPLLTLMGVDPLPVRPTLTARCTDGLKKATARREFPRGILFEQDGEWWVRPVGKQGSGVLSSMADANCFIVLPEDTGNVAAGDAVAVQ
ncbi:MAG: gephyrin-like molybdotransferase Glp, partial [Thiotrichales bacterium]